MVAHKNDNTLHRKNIILREAARLFRERGYMASNLREIAKRSGVKGGSIYHHFSSKEEILYQIMDDTMTDLLSNLKGEIEKKSGAAAKLRRAIRYHIEYHIQNPCETYVTDAELRSLNGSNYKRMVRKRDEYENIFIEILEQGARSGTMNINNAKLSSIAILQMCTGVNYWFRKEGPLTAEAVADHYVDFILWGALGKVKE